MQTYDTLTEALDGLRKQGFTQDYNLKSDYLHCQTTNIELRPADFTIVDVYRFEGMTNPDDESVLYAIEAKNGDKGVLVDAYGMYAEAISPEMARSYATRPKTDELFRRPNAFSTNRTYVSTMNWNKLTSDAQLDTIKEESIKQPVLIFKHSTSCSISAMALSRMERNWNDQLGVKPYYLDLLANRPISNKIENVFGVEHESPQVLLIRNGACIYDASHMSISFAGLQQAV